MAVNFEDIRQSYFVEYKKYWIIFFVLLLCYFANSIIRHRFGTSRTTMNIENAIYITSGVAINEKYVIADKGSVEGGCVGVLSGLLGSFYVATGDNLYPARIEVNDPVSNMILVRLTGFHDRLKSFALLQMDEPKYDINRRLLVPFTLNAPGAFSFKSARIVGDNGGSVFFVSMDNTFRKKPPIGMPVFNRNYVLQGLIKENDGEYSGKTRRDSIFNSMGLEHSYSVNKLSSIRRFLDRNGVEYSIIGDGTNLEKTYNIKDSVVNIICVKTY